MWRIFSLIMHLINSSIRITTALTSGKSVIVFQDTRHLELFHLPSQYHIRLLPLHRRVSVDFQHSFYYQLAARLSLKTSPSHDLLSFLTTNLISRYSEQAWKSGNMLVSAIPVVCTARSFRVFQHRSTRAAVDGRRASPDNNCRPPLSIVNQYSYLFKVHYGSSNISGMGRNYNPKEKDVERLN